MLIQGGFTWNINSQYLGDDVLPYEMRDERRRSGCDEGWSSQRGPEVNMLQFAMRPDNYYLKRMVH